MLRKMLLIFTIIGFAVACVSTILQYLHDEKEKKELHKNELELNHKIDSLLTDNKELNSKAKDLVSQNIELSDKLSKSTLKLNDAVFGNNFLDIKISPINNTQFILQYCNNSELPVYDARISVTNCNDLLQCREIKKDEDFIYFDRQCATNVIHYEKNITNFGPGAMISGSKVYEISDIINFSINILSRKGSLKLQYVFKKIDFGYEYCYRSFIEKNKKFEFKKEHYGFDLPKDHWEKYFFGKRTIRYLTVSL